MKEIGGYIELDSYHNLMLHEEAIKLNCAKNCLAYLIKKKSIKRIHLPIFICDSIFDVCEEYGVEMLKYHIDNKFHPNIAEEVLSDDWIYLVNYYGQLPREIVINYKNKYSNIILDNVQDYFADPIDGIDTFYSCRKFFGVADGAILYTDISLDEDIPFDVSYSRMGFLLGRYEKGASEFYQDYVNNNRQTRTAPILRMSKLTENLLHGIDYVRVKNIRDNNFNYLHNLLQKHNKIAITEPSGAFVYPFYYEKGMDLRKELISSQIYVPTLWPNVVNICGECLEKDMAANILPLPVDQRYSLDEMEYVAKHILQYIERVE